MTTSRVGEVGGHTVSIAWDMQAQSKEEDSPAPRGLRTRFSGFGHVSTSPLLWTGSPSQKALQPRTSPLWFYRGESSILHTSLYAGNGLVLNQKLIGRILFQCYLSALLEIWMRQGAWRNRAPLTSYGPRREIPMHQRVLVP